ncbi:MAG: Mut7-C RNAse domain-containing protein [Smithellaceae bacterium]|nr:Mut7-C RNAse domain-containing protein [Smithellaceae bacterium]
MHNTELKFIVDHNVGKMAKWLRMAGFNAHLFTGADDAAMVAAALAENRILLTRDRRIMKRHVIVVGGIQAILVESDQFKAQVQQIISALRLNISSFRPFTRCIECNRRIEERAKETIKERVPPYVYRTQERFAECPACHRLYWQGTHWQAMSRAIHGILSLEKR